MTLAKTNKSNQITEDSFFNNFRIDQIILFRSTIILDYLKLLGARNSLLTKLTP